MSMTSIKQINGGKELQGDVRALLNIVGKDKEAFFNEILNWLLAEAPQDFNPEILKNSKLAMLVGSAVNVNSKPDAPSKTPYLSFIEENGETFTIKTSSGAKNWDGTLEYSTNTQNWSEWDGTEIGSSNDGKLYLRGTNNTYITGESYDNFVLTSGKSIQCIGNIENLLDYATVAAGNHPTMANNCYLYMFTDCTSLTTAPELPATTLSESCYSSLFTDCTSLTTAPELPATTLSEYCYNGMFWGCKSLTTAPELPATTLAESCYNGMFQGCTSLTTAPELPATTLPIMCYANMFWGCKSLTTAPELPATTLAESCYNGMFYDCTNLTTAPSQLPATTLAIDCYSGMFQNCTSLTGTIHCPTSTSSDSNRLDTSARNLPANTATVVYDL